MYTKFESRLLLRSLTYIIDVTEVHARINLFDAAYRRSASSIPPLPQQFQDVPSQELSFLLTVRITYSQRLLPRLFLLTR